jgi:hypothetical protein
VRQFDGQKWNRTFKQLEAIASMIDSQSLNVHNRKDQRTSEAPGIIQSIGGTSSHVQDSNEIETLLPVYRPVQISVQISKKDPGSLVKSQKLANHTINKESQVGTDSDENDVAGLTRSDSEVKVAYATFAKKRNNDWRPWWLKEGAERPSTNPENNKNVQQPSLKNSVSTPGILKNHRSQAPNIGKAWSAEGACYQTLSNPGHAWSAGSNASLSRGRDPAKERRKTSRLHEALAAASSNPNCQGGYFNGASHNETAVVRRISFDATRGGKDEGIGRRDFTWARCESEKEIQRPVSASCGSMRKRPASSGSLGR